MHQYNDYYHILKKVKAIQKLAIQQQRRPLTIAELAEIIGGTEEHVLESIEYGQPACNKKYLH